MGWRSKFFYDRFYFNVFKVSEFNIKNEKCVGIFYLMGICLFCFLVKKKKFVLRMRFGKS